MIHFSIFPITLNQASKNRHYYTPFEVGVLNYIKEYVQLNFNYPNENSLLQPITDLMNILFPGNNFSTTSISNQIKRKEGSLQDYIDDFFSQFSQFSRKTVTLDTVLKEFFSAQKKTLN